MIISVVAAKIWYLKNVRFLLGHLAVTYMYVCRSRSMSEVDVLAGSDVDDDVVVFHEQLVEPIQLTLFTPQLATTVVTPSPTITAPSMTSSLPRYADVTRGKVLSIAYESGTMSASVSRDHSPQRYPRPPPSMIISPAHCRSMSADRTSSSSQHNSAALRRLVKRLSDVIDVDDDVIRSDGVTSAAAAPGRCHGNNAERRHGDGSDVTATSDSGHISRKAGSHTEMSSVSSAPGAAGASSAASSVTSSMTSSTANSRMSRWTATLALFRKKTRRVENTQTTSSSSSAPLASVARPLQEQRASLSSGDVVASVETCPERQVHSNLSQSQPLHHSTAVSPPAAASGHLAAASSSSSRASKLARIIDPLKLRRRPNSTAAVDLSTTLMTPSGGEVKVMSRRQQAMLAGMPASRRARHSLTSAYMQGSL